MAPEISYFDVYDKGRRGFFYLSLAMPTQGLGTTSAAKNLRLQIQLLIRLHRKTGLPLNRLFCKYIDHLGIILLFLYSNFLVNG